MKKILKTLISVVFIATLIFLIAVLGLELIKEKKAVSTYESEYADLLQENTQLKEDLNKIETVVANNTSYFSEDDLTDLDLVFAKKQASKEDKEKAYKLKYKNLYVKKTEEVPQGKKVVHLTFDDGPSYITPKVLDVLDEYNIKATFFVVYNDEEPYNKYYKEIVKRGHTIAVHTASHDYKKVYTSVDSYLEDFEKIYNYIYEQTGVYPTLFRYPGGSTNCEKYAAGPEIMAEMERRGFTYFDWNVSSGDGSIYCDVNSIKEKVLPNASVLPESVILMHDAKGKEQTLLALPEVIEALKEAGCVFEPLTDETVPVQFPNE